MATLEEIKARRKLQQEMMVKALMQPSYIQPGEPPAKAWQPAIQALGGMIADKRLAGQEEEATANYQKALAEALAPGVDNETAARRLMQNPDTSDMGLKLLLSQKNASNNVPAGLQEFMEFEKSPPERQKQWLEFKRGPNILNLGGEMAVRTPGGGIGETYKVSPKPEQMPEFKGAQARSEAEAKAGVELETDSTKRAIKAGNVSDLITEAETQLKDATGSYLGTGLALGKRAVGMSDKSTQANQQLKLISGWLVSNVPRMEGPQSNYDVQNYKEMAGMVGDTTVPVGDRMAALQRLKALQQKYTNQGPMGASGETTKSIGGKTYVKRNGQWFEQ